MVQVFFLVGYCRFVSLDLFPSFLPSPSINTRPDNKSLVISFSIQGMDSTRDVSESTLSLRVWLFGTRRLPPVFSPLDLYTKVGMYLCFFTLSSMILKISSHSNFERPISLHCVTRRSAFCTVLTRVVIHIVLDWQPLPVLQCKCKMVCSALRSGFSPLDTATSVSKKFKASWIHPSP